jgi:Fur family transcriptional regulator, ferric uptake regulator
MRLSIIPRMTATAPLLRTLDEAGYRVTAPRRALAEIISERRGCFTAADLVAAVRTRRLGIGRATIFRALELFEGLGVVERLDLPSGEHAYVPCESTHHHHVVCSRCGRTQDVDDPGIDALVGSIGQRTGYRIESHRLELFGLCPACAGAAGPA